MTTQEQPLSPGQGMEIIQEMIQKAKRSFNKISFYFLLWGILLFFSGIAEYILMHMVKTEYHWVVWPVMGVIGGIAAGIHGARESKKQPTYGFADLVIGYVWIAFGISLVLTIVATVTNGLPPSPFILILTGFPTFVTGAILKFRPLILGGFVFWAVGMASFYVLHEYMSLLYSGAILFGYIIPGLMLKRENL